MLWTHPIVWRFWLSGLPAQPAPTRRASRSSRGNALAALRREARRHGLP